MKKLVLLLITVVVFAFSQEWQLVNPLPAGRWRTTGCWCFTVQGE